MVFNLRDIGFPVHIRMMVIKARTMDKTPVYFSMHPRTTLNFIDECTIHIISTYKITSRVSSSIGITVSGRVLKPMLTFKDVPTGKIASRREFPTYTYLYQQGRVSAHMSGKGLDLTNTNGVLTVERIRCEIIQQQKK